MLKKLIILLIAIAPLAVTAQTVKIAYINSQEIFGSMPEVPEIETQLNSKQEEVNKNGQALIEEFNKKAAEFEKIAATASETVKASQQQQLVQLQERYQQYVQNSQKEQQDLYQQLVSPVNQKIQTAIKAVGDEKGYTYIFDIATPQSPIIYWSETAENATPLVRTKLGLK